MANRADSTPTQGGRRRLAPLPQAELRRRLEAAVEHALAALDALDGDCDAEAEQDCCDAADDDLSSRPCRLEAGAVAGPGTPEDAEPDADDEPNVIRLPRLLRIVQVTA